MSPGAGSRPLVTCCKIFATCSARWYVWIRSADRTKPYPAAAGRQAGSNLAKPPRRLWSCSREDSTPPPRLRACPPRMPSEGRPEGTPKGRYSALVPRIVLLEGDLTTQDVDAIVNAANA